MADRMIPVPESLIERTVQALAFEGIDVPELSALLSQPTPTVEPIAVQKLERVRELARKARHGSERWADPLPVPQYVLDLEAILDGDPTVTPPSIADMVPGTTFRGSFRGSGMTWPMEVRSGGVVRCSGSDWPADLVDPFTIREIRGPEQ